MRSLILTAAFATALAVTTLSPGRADAQVFYQSGYSPVVPAGYWSPGYNYSYAWTTPYYTTYSSAWGSPYIGNYNWTWYTPNYYAGYRSVWPRGYGWRGPYWRW